jgi:8-oxo-dGTP diphosphatase
MRNANLTIKLALLSVRANEVNVALTNDLPPALPASQPVAGESLDAVAWDRIEAITGARTGYIEQLYTFSFPGDEDDEIVISYLGLVSSETSVEHGWQWAQQTDAFALIGEHDQLILEYALIRLRAKIGYTTIAFQLMPKSFSLGELQQTYESILSRPLDPRNFRRGMVSSGLLEPENKKRRDGSHRPAALYRFSGEHDPASYLTPLTRATGRESGQSNEGRS